MVDDVCRWLAKQQGYSDVGVVIGDDGSAGGGVKWLGSPSVVWLSSEGGLGWWLLSSSPGGGVGRLCPSRLSAKQAKVVLGRGGEVGCAAGGDGCWSIIGFSLGGRRNRQ
ncbi:hypothetical protein Dimus_015256, partial [Dionaea muscipula]